MSSIPKNIKSLKPLFGHKQGDRIHYKTPRGKVKILIFGEQTWYNRSAPKRVVVTLRGKTWLREPTLSEVIGFTMQKRAKKLKEAVMCNNVLFDKLSQNGSLKKYDGGSTMLGEVKFKVDE